LQMLQDSEGKAGMPPQLWGDTPGASGYDRMKAFGQGITVLLSRMDTLKWWYQALFRLMWRQYGRYGVRPIPYVATDRQTGQRTAEGRITPWEVQGVATHIEVKWGRLQHVDLNAMGNLAAMLTDRGVVSHEYALSELMGVDNPTAVMRQALRDQFYKDPALLRLRVLAEKMQDSMDPIGARLAQFLFANELQKFEIMASQPPQGPAGPGPGPQQPPLPQPGQPPQAMPPPMGPGAGLPPNAAMQGPPQAGAGLQLA